MNALSRRRFLRGSLIAATGVLVAACQPKVVEKVVKETVEVEKVVEKVVEKTVEIEKIVTQEVVKAADPGPKMTVWAPKHFIQAQNDYFTDSVLLAAARNNFEVEVQLFPWGDYQQKQNAAIEAKTLPDIILGINIARYSTMGILEDVDDLFQEIGETGGGWFESNEANVKVDGKAVGIPFHNEPQVMYYRADLFSAAGFEAPPKDMDEFVAMTKAVTNPANGIYGFGNTFSDVPDGNNVFWGILWAFGGKVQDENGEIVFNSQETIDALTWYTDLYLKHKVMPEAVTGWDDTGNNKAWLAGQCACIYNSGSILNAMRTDDPGFAEHVVVGPTPAGPAGPKTYQGGSTAGIMKGTKSHEQAAEILRTILSPERYPNNLRSAGGMFYPVLKNYEQDPFFQEDPWNKATASMVQYAQYAHQPGPIAAWIDEIGGKWTFSRMAAKVAINGVSPAQAVEEAAAEMAEMKTKYENL